MRSKGDEAVMKAFVDRRGLLFIKGWLAEESKSVAMMKLILSVAKVRCVDLCVCIVCRYTYKGVFLYFFGGGGVLLVFRRLRPCRPVSRLFVFMLFLSVFMPFFSLFSSLFSPQRFSQAVSLRRRVVI